MFTSQQLEISRGTLTQLTLVATTAISKSCIVAGMTAILCVAPTIVTTETEEEGPADDQS